MRPIIPLLASLISFVIFGTARDPALPADQRLGGLALAAGLALVGLLSGWWNLRHRGVAEDSRAWRLGSWAAISLGGVSLAVQALLLVARAR